eukprot:TRINITY_DN51532_c0_g1_i1.p1 TRINITY_DN51532_c0_g1~~TRINITY_DN51532_c0_g1_i1.p1  ORF type:complete len:369 (+),score=94.43 TRINITY_DN51532_c0_g1_i1:98-1204(+)
MDRRASAGSVGDILSRRESSWGWKHQPHPSAKGAEASGCLKVAEAFAGKEQQETVFCVRFSHDGKYLACTFGNGALRLLDVQNWQTVQRVKPLAHNPEGLAMTCVRWRPHCPRKSYDLVTSCSSGAAIMWTWDQDDPKAELDCQHTILEAGNETMCCDYSQDGNMIATGGKDHCVRIYDTLSTKLSKELKHGVDDRGYVREAHPSRIFCTRFVGPHTLVSAGWQTACQVWDLRTGKSERQLMGSHVCGDSVEVNFNTSNIIVASYRNHDQLKVYDYLSGRECTPDGLSRNLGETMLYSTRLCQDQTTLWCCGGKPNGIFQLDIRNGELLGSVTGLGATFFTCGLFPGNNYKTVFGGSKDSLIVVDTEK